MSKIIFHKVSWKNFLSTGSSPTTLTLDDHATTLIIGENGAGKSTMLDAVIFALYGKAYRKVNKPQIPNSINKKQCVVELEFTAKGTKYKIIRGIKPDTFEIYKGEELINQDANAKDYQNVLEQQILGGLDHKAFLQTAVLGSANYTPFLELKSSDRSEIVEDILDIKIFSIMKTVLKEQIADSKMKSDTIMNELSNLKQQVEAKNELITKMEQMTGDNTKVFENNIATANAEIERLKGSIASKQAEVPGIQARLDTASAEVASKQAEINAQDEVVTSMEKTLAEKEATHQGSKKAELQEHNSKLNSEISVLNADKARHEQSLKFYGDNDNCPTCTQPIQADFKSNKVSQLQTDIAEIEAKVADFNGAITANNAEIEKLNLAEQEVANYRNEVQSARNKVSSLNAELTPLNSQVSSIETELNNAKNAQESVEKEIAIHEQSITQNQQSIENAKTSNADDLAKEKQARDELCQQGVEKEASSKEIANLRGLEDIATKMLKDNGIKTSIIHEYLPVLNKRINNYLAKFDSYISFNIDESFNEVVKSRHRDNFSYANFSEGEKLRIDLSLLLAFRDLAKMKNSTSTNLLIMDEVFDASLDSQGADFLMEIIRSMESSNIVVISHRADSLLDKFKRVIAFKKQGDYSVMDTDV